MKQRPTKAELRQELQHHIEEFLRHGGEIEDVARGASALARDGSQKPEFAFDRPREERTPVQEVVAAIEARKSKSAPPTKPRRRRPQKKPVYDDFGELIRWVWVDE